MTQTAEQEIAPPDYHLGKLAASTVAVLALGFVVFVLASTGVGAGFALVMGADGMSEFSKHFNDVALPLKDPVLLDFFAYLGFLVYGAPAAAMWIVWRVSGVGGFAERIAWRDWRGDRAFYGLALAAFAWGLAAGAVIEWLLPESRNWIFLPKSHLGLAASLVVVSMVGPVCEEMFFRGWLYTGMRGRLGFPATLALTSVLFAVIHWEPTHLYAVAVAPVGFILGYIRERYGSIKASALAHGLYNLLGWTIAYFIGA